MEGTFTTPREMALFDPGDGKPGSASRVGGGTREVLNCVRALDEGLRLLGEEGLPIGGWLFRRLHGTLFEGVPGGDPGAGSFRTGQNYIGRRIDGIAGARFVPPPPGELAGCLGDLERYIHEQVSLDAPWPLFMALALVHYQFEAIHPFQDGNGRIGRLLIPLILVDRKATRDPILHVSLVLERRREEYVERMLRVSQRGEWEEWILFFLRVVEAAAKEAMAKVEALLALRVRYREMVQTRRSSALLPRLMDGLFRRPSLTIHGAARTLEVSHAQASTHVRRLEKLGVLTETTGGSRNLEFVAGEILEILFE